MHLGNGAITPECALLTYAAAAAGLAAGVASARREGVTGEKLLLSASLGSAVFAAQALNVPVSSGFSAHLVGGVLVAWLLGPGLGVWIMAIVLAIQASVLGDGGWAALGANMLNMALVPAGLVAIVRRLGVVDRDSARCLAIAGGVAGLAVVLAAGLIVIETALFRPAIELRNWDDFASIMLATHAWIGLLEGVATAGLVAAFHWMPSRSSHSHAPRGNVRPDALRPFGLRPSLCCTVAALVIAAFCCPWSSGLPDGYEAAAIASCQQQLLSE